MSTEKLRAAAISILHGWNTEEKHSDRGISLLADNAVLLADTYLTQLEAEEQQAADGALPVDEEWLCDTLHKVCEYTFPWSGETVAVFSMQNGYSIRRYVRDDNSSYHTIWNDKGNEGVLWHDNPTRQQVLDLMRALGATSEPHTTTPSRR